MNKYGCCSQGFVFPRQKARDLIAWYEEAHVGFVVEKARVVHCERSLGALRHACRRGVAMVVDVVMWPGCNK